MSFVLGLWDLNAICSKLSCANFAILKIKHIVPEKLKFYYQIKSNQIIYFSGKQIYTLRF